MITDANDVNNYLDAMGKLRVAESRYDTALKANGFKPEKELRKGQYSITRLVSRDEMIAYSKNEGVARFEVEQGKGQKGTALPHRPAQPGKKQSTGMEH